MIIQAASLKFLPRCLTTSISNGFTVTSQACGDIPQQPKHRTLAETTELYRGCGVGLLPGENIVAPRKILSYHLYIYIYIYIYTVKSLVAPKSQNLNVSRLVLQLSLPNPLKQGVENEKVENELEQRRRVIKNFIAYWGATYIRGLTGFGCGGGCISNHLCTGWDNSIRGNNFIYIYMYIYIAGQNGMSNGMPE